MFGETLLQEERRNSGETTSEVGKTRIWIRPEGPEDQNRDEARLMEPHRIRGSHRCGVEPNHKSLLEVLRCRLQARPQAVF